MLKNVLVCQDTDEDLLDTGNYSPKKNYLLLENQIFVIVFSGTKSIREK